MSDWLHTLVHPDRTLTLFISTIFLLLVSFVGTGVFRKYALKKNLLDIPNSRSSHSSPTPRGAGIVFVILTILTTLITEILYANSISESIFVLLAFTVVALLGAIDDLYNLSPKLRLSIQLAASLAVLFTAGSIPTIQLFSDISITSPLIAGTIFTVGLIWMLNLFNFMDGTDGYAALEGIFISITGGVLLILAQSAFWVWPFALAISLLGFLPWNLPTAKVFMGDVGSSFIGFFIACIALLSHQENTISIWIWLILSGVFAVDATVTLLRRLILGNRYSDAHRTHAYQLITRKYGNHWRALKYASTLNIFWLLPMAIVAFIWPTIAFLLCIVAYTPLIFIIVCAGAGVDKNPNCQTS